MGRRGLPNTICPIYSCNFAILHTYTDPREADPVTSPFSSEIARLITVVLNDSPYSDGENSLSLTREGSDAAYGTAVSDSWRIHLGLDYGYQVGHSGPG